MKPDGQFYQTEGPNTGTALPTRLIDGKEYPVFLLAQSSGHIQGSLDTFTALADAVAFAANKQMFSIFNGAGSGKVIKLRKVFFVNLALAAVTGVATRIEFKRITARSAGTVITPMPHDSLNAALPAAVVAATGSTVTEGALWFPFTMTNDEVGATQAFPSSQLLQATNWLPEGDNIQEMTLREGEGLTIKNITSTTVGSLGIVVVFTAE